MQEGYSVCTCMYCWSSKSKCSVQQDESKTRGLLYAACMTMQMLAHAHMCKSTHMHKHTCVRIHTQTHMRTYVHIHMRTHARAYTRTHVNIFKHAHAQQQIHETKDPCHTLLTQALQFRMYKMALRRTAHEMQTFA